VTTIRRTTTPAPSHRLQPPLLVSHLAPSAFAAVMATGIVSVAAAAVGLPIVSDGLFGVAAALAVTLTAAYVLRLFTAVRSVAQDLGNPSIMFGYFTLVAGFGVLGARCALGGFWDLGAALGLAALLIWIFLVYFLPAVLMVHLDRSGADSVNGTWLLAAVGTEALSVLAAILWGHFRDVPGLALAGVGWWGLGALLYLFIMAAVMRRLFFSRLEPKDLTAPYWINMGGVAITTLAGSLWASIAHPNLLLLSIRPALIGMTLALWAFGTWWIPLLIIAGFWKHVAERVPLRYDPALWSLVFPLGMYCVATYHLSRLPGFEPLAALVRPAFWVALTAWTAVAVGWCRRAGQWFRQRRSKAS
jgi:tellurite resistance protein TehA-like permease